jgi:hypothetical protein
MSFHASNFDESVDLRKNGKSTVPCENYLVPAVAIARRSNAGL